MVKHIPIGMELSEMLETYKVVIDSAIRNKHFLSQTGFIDWQITRMGCALISTKGLNETILEWQTANCLPNTPYDPSGLYNIIRTKHFLGAKPETTP